MRFCLFLLIAVTCLHAEDTTLCTISIPNTKASKDSFTNSVIGQALLDEDMLEFREWLFQLSPNTEHITLVEELWKNSTSIRFALIETDKKPALRIHINGDLDKLHKQLTSTIDGLLPSNMKKQSQYINNTFLYAIEVPPAKIKIDNTDADGIFVSWNIDKILSFAQKMSSPTKKQEIVFDLLRKMSTSGHLSLSFGDSFFKTTSLFKDAKLGIKPIDQKIFSKIPSDTKNIFVAALDIAPWWIKYKKGIFSAIATIDPMYDNAEMLQLQANAALMFINMNDLEELSRAFTGTFAVISGEPILMYPNLNFLIPRNPEMDKLITNLITMARQTAPEEGEFQFIVAKGWNPMGGDIVPGSLAIGRAKNYWAFGMDSTIVESLIQTNSDDWLKTKTGKIIQKNLSPECCSIATFENKSVKIALQHVVGFLANLCDKGKYAEAMLRFGHKLAKTSQPSVMVLNKTDAGIECSAEGIFPLPPTHLSVIAIVAAIAVPNLLESRITANESAAAASLKSGVFPAQVCYQAGAYLDEDSDGVGSYSSSYKDMSGGGKIKLQLLSPDWNADKPLICGYYYKIILPKNEDDKEKYWAAFAWPKSSDQGRRIFAITQNGNIYCKNIDVLTDYINGPNIDEFQNVWPLNLEENSWRLYRR